jgi:hypothetical protein
MGKTSINPLAYLTLCKIENDEEKVNITCKIVMLQVDLQFLMTSVSVLPSSAAEKLNS